ncbi:hypothetical protein WJX79_000205 [Trebouxia sp. C0005]
MWKLMLSFARSSGSYVGKVSPFATELAGKGLSKSGDNRALRLRTGSCSCVRATFSSAASSTTGSGALGGAHAQRLAPTATSINEATYGTAKDDLSPAQQALPPTAAFWPYQSTAATEIGHKPAQQASHSNHNTVNPHQSPMAQQTRRNGVSHQPNAGATVTSRQSSKTPPLPPPPSAPSNGSRHLLGSSDAASAQTSASEPSQYAHKEVQFDVAASRKQGGNAIRDLLETQKITLQEYAPGQKPKTRCPRCHGGSQHEDSLAVNISVDSQSAAWKCHRATCGWEGGIDQKAVLPKSMKTAVSKVEKPQTGNFRPLTPEFLAYFASRGISEGTLRRNQVAQESTWMPGQPAGDAIAFPYLRNGEVVNVKYRTMNKCFRQVKGAEKILYGLDDVVGQDTIIIVEGEMDKLALEEAGFMNVVSVPDGAPAKVKEAAVPAPDADTKYSYLWNCRAVLDQATRVLMATDNDPPGHALAEELARRLGRERCYRVHWELPQPEPLNGEEEELSEEALIEACVRKDANEVLMKNGPDALRLCIDQAEPLPIRGLFRFSDFEQDVWSLYNLEFGDQMGKSTGWQSLDEVYRVVPGELTIITGVPNSGKSEWIDALMVNLADRFGWRFGLCSMEKKVTDHARQLMEKHLRKPFFDGGYAGSTPRMTADDLGEGIAWVDDRFFPIRYEDEALPSVDWVLNVAKAAVLRYGIRGLLVDPYNELDHQRPSHMSETEYVSQMLTKIKRFAQHHDVHVWFVAHPRQLRDWKGQPPTMYDISGSAHFINKADNGLVIHRNRDPQAGPMNEVQIFVRKVRNKAAGTIGDCKLEYDRATGCYLDHAQMAYGALPPSQEARVLSLPPSAEPTYDEALIHSVNGDSHKASDSFTQPAASSSFSASSFGSNLSEIDKVMIRGENSGVNGGPGFDQPVKHDRTMQRPRPDVKPQQGLSTDELDYHDTDFQPGDMIQQYEHGRPRQTAGNAV